MVRALGAHPCLAAISRRLVRRRARSAPDGGGLPLSGRRAQGTPSAFRARRGAARVRGATGCGRGTLSSATAALPAERSPRNPRRPRGEWPREGSRPPLFCPKLREPEPPRRAGAARRAAVCGGLSSGNSLRETEGKTSRGRSAVIGLETDLKGKVSAAAVTAAQPA